MTNDSKAPSNNLKILDSRRQPTNHLSAHSPKKLPRKIGLHSISITHARPPALELVNMVNDLWHTARLKSIPTLPHSVRNDENEQKESNSIRGRNFSHESVKLSACASSKNLRCAISQWRRRSPIGEWNRNTTPISFRNFKAWRNNETIRRGRRRMERSLYKPSSLCTRTPATKAPGFSSSLPLGQEASATSDDTFLFHRTMKGGETEKSRRKQKTTTTLRLSKLEN